jgi:shikimate kinase
MKSTNIVLIGFMGSGKTTVGKILAERTGMDFIDTDLAVEMRASKKIPRIFKEYGESFFRKLESDMVEEVSLLSGAVIATGGGVINNDANITALARDGRIFFMSWSVKALLEHTADTDDRPLLDTSDRSRQIKELLAKREPLYIQACDSVILCEGKSPECIAEEILEKWEVMCHGTICGDTRC